MKKNLILFLILIAIIGLGSLAYQQYANREIESDKPSITLISPNGGELLASGSVHNIKWDTRNMPTTNKISITIRRVAPPALQEEGQEFDPIIFVNLENTGSKEWNVSEMYPEGNYILGITSYESVPINNPISDESDATFSITKDTGELTYTNNKFGYSINYPSDWTFREFPDTRTGSGFRPLNSPDDIASECITIDARETAERNYNLPFDEYVKVAGKEEIQNYEKLNSIEPITTDKGLSGYKTTWAYRDFSGQEKISLPISYFDNKKITQGQNSQLKFKTFQIILNNQECEEVYNKMLSTFSALE